MKALKQFLAIISLFAAMAAVNSALAQDQPRRPGQPDGARPPAERPDGERPRGEFRGGPDGPRGGNFLGLTEEQREILRSANEEHRDEMGRLGERMREARRGLSEATLAEKLDLEAVKSHAKELAEVQAEMSVIQAQVLAKLRPKLTAEQIERMRNMPMEFITRGGMGPGFGGPGGFRPGGPDAPRPEGQRLNPDDASRRPRGDGDRPANGGDRPRRPAPDLEPK